MAPCTTTLSNGKKARTDPAGLSLPSAFAKPDHPQRPLTVPYIVILLQFAVDCKSKIAFWGFLDDLAGLYPLLLCILSGSSNERLYA